MKSENFLNHSYDRLLSQTCVRLIHKSYKVDPLLYPKCSSEMRVIVFIEDPDVVKKILNHLVLSEARRIPKP